MNKATTLLFIFVLFLTSHKIYAQKTTVSLLEREPEYKLIVDVIVSPVTYYDEQVSDYESGYRFRLIITRARIFESIFLEKQILNSEGGVYKSDWVRKIDTIKLVDQLGVSTEKMNFKNLKWLDSSTFQIYLSNKKLKSSILSKDSITFEE